ncbi:hypothetical protein HYV50_01615 [Candidatus Pacearchaeota archaeon]|nr:hypothetical protein [Candidatus Pacearchaeota archaeon]
MLHIVLKVLSKESADKLDLSDIKHLKNRLKERIDGVFKISEERRRVINKILSRAINKKFDFSGCDYQAAIMFQEGEVYSLLEDHEKALESFSFAKVVYQHLCDNPNNSETERRDYGIKAQEAFDLAMLEVDFLRAEGKIRTYRDFLLPVNDKTHIQYERKKSKLEGLIV